MLSSGPSSNRSEPFGVWTFSATWFGGISTSSSVILDQVRSHGCRPCLDNRKRGEAGERRGFRSTELAGGLLCRVRCSAASEHRRHRLRASLRPHPTVLRHLHPANHLVEALSNCQVCVGKSGQLAHSELPCSVQGVPSSRKTQDTSLINPALAQQRILDCIRQLQTPNESNGV